MKHSKYYKEASDDDILTDARRVYKKLQTVNSEYMKWFEVLLTINICTTRILLYVTSMVINSKKNTFNGNGETR